MRRNAWFLTIGLVLIVPILAIGWWLSAGGPTGFAVHEAGTRIGNREIRVASERVLGRATMRHVPPDGLALLVDDFQFLFRKGELTNEAHDNCPLPEDWRSLEIRAARNALNIIADGKTVTRLNRNGDH